MQLSLKKITVYIFVTGIFSLSFYNCAYDENSNEKLEQYNPLYQDAITRLRGLIDKDDVYDFEKKIDAELEFLKDFSEKNDSQQELSTIIAGLNVCIDQASNRTSQAIRSDVFKKISWGVLTLYFGLQGFRHSLLYLVEARLGRSLFLSQFSGEIMVGYKFSTPERVLYGVFGSIFMPFSLLTLYSCAKTCKRLIGFSWHTKSRHQFLQRLSQKLFALEQEISYKS